jgi:hypothetical protein
MDKSEREYLLEMWGENICPNCAKAIPEASRVGSGKKSDGGFCSLDCYAEYHKRALAQRAFHVATIAKRHRES